MAGPKQIICKLSSKKLDQKPLMISEQKSEMMEVLFKKDEQYKDKPL